MTTAVVMAATIVKNATMVIIKNIILYIIKKDTSL
jgi:hypothetical protein